MASKRKCIKAQSLDIPWLLHQRDKVFMRAWEKHRPNYQYGSDALSNVYVGWKLARELARIRSKKKFGGVFK